MKYYLTLALCASMAVFFFVMLIDTDPSLWWLSLILASFFGVFTTYIIMAIREKLNAKPNS